MPWQQWEHRTVSKRRFTLLELLIVIAIILILASVLLPTLSKVKMRAKDLLCVNKAKQIGIMLFSYAGDHSGRLPPCQTVPWIAPQIIAGNYAIDDPAKRQGLGLLIQAGLVTVKDVQTTYPFHCLQNKELQEKYNSLITPANVSFYWWGISTYNYVGGIIYTLYGLNQSVDYTCLGRASSVEPLLWDNVVVNTADRSTNSHMNSPTVLYVDGSATRKQFKITTNWSPYNYYGELRR